MLRIYKPRNIGWAWFVFLDASLKEIGNSVSFHGKTRTYLRTKVELFLGVGAYAYKK